MRFIYLIVFGLFLAVNSFAPMHANAAVCQNKTKVVFGNGVFNSRDDAKRSRDYLEDSLGRRAKFSPFVGLAYANDGGAAPTLSGALPAMGQLLELFLQSGPVDTTNYWKWVSDKLAAPQWFRNGMKQIAAGVNAANYVIDKDVRRHVAIYEASLKAGNKVVIVSHSQGNFYSNAAYRLLATAGYGNNVGIVAVATPSRIVEGGGTYITAPEDKIIAAVRLLSFRTVLPANFGNQIRPRNADWFNHNFINFYMQGIETKAFIIDDIVKAGNRLQYPKKCALSPLIPQPGPFYYRDDWGDLTYDKTIPDLSPYFVVRDPHRQFKHLRDDRRGLAYKVQLSQKIDRASNWYNGPHQMMIGITDYTTSQFRSLYYIFPDTFVPNDVVLWSGGIMLLKYDYNFYYNRPTKVTWRKISIQDAGVGTANRWSIISVGSGTFSFPAYRVTNYEKTGFAISSPYQYVTRMYSTWNKVGVAYRESTSYTYRIPYTASRAEWTNAPAGLFNYFVNGQYKSLPNVPTKTWLGDYGVLEIVDGALIFVKEGRIPLVSSNFVQLSIPIINGFAKIKQSIAYKYTQSFLVEADKVDETGLLQWSGDIILKAVLAKGEYFFNPPQTLHRSFSRGSTGIPQYRFRSYSEIFTPFSLSSSMAMLSGTGVSLPWFTQARYTSYKLGLGFKINSNDQRFLATNPLIKLPSITRTGGVVQVSAGQKVFMENTVNSMP